jgi:anti-sigma-K factor RskA
MSTTTTNGHGVHALAQKYVERALKIQERDGTPAHLSDEDLKAVVERAESALRDLVPSSH